MSMSDCIKCWDTPCTCGWEYRNWKISYLKKQVKIFNRIIEYRSKYPQAKFSSFSMDKETTADKEIMEYIRTGEVIWED
jgi:hypothetical protein